MNLLKAVGGADLASLAKASEVMVKVPKSKAPAATPAGVCVRAARGKAHKAH